MMTDKELTALAAKAAGHTIRFTWEGNGAGEAINYREEEVAEIRWEESPTHYGYTVWSPLTDDGDALRLQAALKLTTGFDDRFEALGACIYCTYPTGEYTCNSIMQRIEGDDRAGATRRAIVCAAAAMGGQCHD